MLPCKSRQNDCPKVRLSARRKISWLHSLKIVVPAEHAQQPNIQHQWGRATAVEIPESSAVRPPLHALVAWRRRASINTFIAF
jgi:hypothetical protein